MKRNRTKSILICITSLSVSGKSIITNLIKNKIQKKYRPTIIMTGDDLRYITKILKYEKILTIFFISLLFFLIQWGCSFYYLNEEIISKVIFESVDDGSFFYPLIKFLSVLDFSNSLNPNIKNLEILPIPFGSIIIHTFFYKFLNIYGLILVDLLGIFLFLIKTKRNRG